MDNRTSGTPPSEAARSDSLSLISYKGATSFSSDVSVSDQSYNGSSDAENAVLITGGNVVFNNVTIGKTGDDSGDSSDFYGTNAAILVKDGATLTMNSGEVFTDGSHANAVFAYDTGKINMTDTTIQTNSNNSGGIMVTGGGTINANDLSVTTSGNSSAAIRSDRGGGIINVEGGVYTTSGVGSPAIYSTANINVKKAILMSTASEGIVIEGKNSVTLDSATLNTTNNVLNGQSETYKSIFIYQSMSGDAFTGKGSFSADDSMIVTNQGDHFYITNTDAEIVLSGNKFIQEDENGAFLRAEGAAWGNSGSNGGNVLLNVTEQEVIGDIVTDSISAVDFRMSGSYFKGAIPTGGDVKMTVSSDSTVVLTGDSYLSSLTNATSDNSNIYGNGFKLYVNGAEVATNTGAASESSFDEFCTASGDNCYESETGEVIDITEVITPTNSSSKKDTAFPTWGYFAIGGGILVAVAVIVGIICMIVRKKKANKINVTSNLQDNFGGQDNSGGQSNPGGQDNPGGQTTPPPVFN